MNTYKKCMLLGWLLVALIASGCAPMVPKDSQQSGFQLGTEELGRANPGYVQWLEKQSIFKKAEQLGTVVSGTTLFWLGPYENPRADAMLRIAPVWLTVDAARTLSPAKGRMLPTLTNSRFLTQVARLGVKGIHIESMRENGKIWGSPTDTHQLGRDTVSLDIAQYVGDSDSFARFVRTANSKGLVVGDQVLPFATGRGADYFLSTRGVEAYKGLYCMVEVPRALWKELPPIVKRARAVQLDDAAIEKLRRERVLPPPLVRDTLPFSLPALRWFVTDEVSGLDGVGRRFVYLGQEDAARPVLNWNDPSASARRAVSGSLIQSIGLQHAAVTGLRIAPLMGIEPAYPSAATDLLSASETAVRAAVAIAQEARRYGGWTFLQDNVPLPVLQGAMRHGVDFAVNHAGSVAALVAFATEDSTLLRQSILAQQYAGFDQKRMINRIQTEPYIDLSFPFMAQDSNMLRQGATAFKKKQAEQVMALLASAGADVFGDGATLYLTPTAYVAYVEGIRSPASMTSAQKEQVANGLAFLGAIHALRPGIMMLSPDELLGTLPLPDTLLEYTTAREALRQNLAGAYDISGRSSGNILTETGLPKAPVAFGKMDNLLRRATSFASQMQTVLRLRASLGMERAELVQVPQTADTRLFAQVYQLPSGNAAKRTVVMTVSNFGHETVTETMTLQRNLVQGKTMLEALQTGTTVSLDDDRVTVSIPPRSVQVFALE